MTETQPVQSLRSIAQASLIALLAITAAGVLASNAIAAPFAVQTCHRSVAGSQTGWADESGPGHFPRTFGCNFEMHVGDGANTTIANGSIARFVFRMPDLGLKITNASATFLGSNGNASRGIEQLAYACRNDGTCGSPTGHFNPAQSAEEINAIGMPGGGADYLMLRGRCYSGNCLQHGIPPLYAYNYVLTVDDPLAPSVAFDANASSLRLDGWNSGTVVANLNAADSQAGVANWHTSYDGNWSHPQGHGDMVGCAGRSPSGPFVTARPCPTGTSNSVQVDTTAFTEGSHQVSFHAADPAQWGAFHSAFKVDNLDPAEPASMAVVGVNENGWQSLNGFDLSWINGDEVFETETQSGIAQSCYDLSPPPGVVEDPVPVCVDGAIDELSDVRVPGDGDWEADLWTVDAAGNESDRAQFNLRLDTTVPGKPTGQANGWISREELIDGVEQFWALPDNHESIASGICGYGFAISESPTDEAPFVIGLAGNVTSAAIPANTREGVSWAHLRAISCAGASGIETEHVEVKVDKTDPDLTVTGVPESGWTNRPEIVGAIVSDGLSGTVGAAPDDPIEFGGSVRFELDDTVLTEARGGHADQDLSNVAEGNHALAVTAFDVARNSTRRSFNFGVDKTAPHGAFIGVDADDPTVLRVPVSDTLSGVASGEVQYAPVGSAGLAESFKPLASTFDGGALIAVFPDTSLPRGDYALRAVVRDAAGNVGFITHRSNGELMVIANPLRASVDLAFGGSLAAKACKRSKSRTKSGKRRANRRFKQCKRARAIRGRTFGTTMNLGYGRATVLNGRLTDRLGRPIADEKIEILQQRVGSSVTLVGGGLTDADGRFRYRAPAGSSRRLIARWPGTRSQQETTATAQVNVAAKVTLRVTPGLVSGRRSIKFKGKVFSQDGVSAAGKLVQLQFRNLRGRWQAGPALVRADRNGAFTYRYRFQQRAGGRERIVFRAFVPPENAWPYAAGSSAARTVRRIR